MGRSKPVTKNKLQLNEILPLTDNQERVFNAYEQDFHLILHGFAGTGKTLLALYLALDDIFTNREYRKVVIIRSVVPTRDMGFLPGKISEKAGIYEEPYIHLMKKLFNRGDAYELLKREGVLEFHTSSFLRGLTLDDTIVIVDECQNMTDQELHTIITRMGDNSKLIVCGDYRQNDLINTREKSGLAKILDILTGMEDFYRIEFNTSDIVRSDLVKDYLIARYNYENDTKKSEAVA